jgi:hypothetical protein
MVFPYIDENRPEAKILERTLEFLQEFDAHSGIFSQAQYFGLLDLSRSPIFLDGDFSSSEVYEILFSERLHRITGLPISHHLGERYLGLRNFVQQQKRIGDYSINPLELMRQPVPFLRGCLDFMSDKLRDVGVYKIKRKFSRSIYEISFSFFNDYFGEMFGKIEVRLNLNGETRFRISGGYEESGDFYLMLRKHFLTGEVDCAKFEIRKVPEMNFRVGAREDFDDVRNVMMVIGGILSYYVS